MSIRALAIALIAVLGCSHPASPGAENPSPGTFVIGRNGSVQGRRLGDQRGDWPTYPEVAAALHGARPNMKAIMKAENRPGATIGARIGEPAMRGAPRTDTAKCSIHAIHGTGEVADLTGRATP